MNNSKNLKLNICIMTLFFTIFTIMMIVFASSSYAASVPDASAQIDSSDGAILRKSASTGSANLAVMSDNTKIVIHKEVFVSKTSTSKKDKWYYITADGKNGYVRSDLVDNIKYGSVSGKTTETVNYRYGPGVEMKKKSSYSGNTNVTIVLQAEPVYSTRGTSATWYKIKVGSDYYYLCSSKAKLTSSSSQSSGSSSASASKAGNSGSAGITAYAQVNASGGATLRKSASASSGSLGTLSDNVQIVIQKEVFTSKTSTSKDYKWYYVTADGKSGYLRSDYVDNIRYGSASGKTTETVNYRYGPGTEMKKKSSYSGNTNVTVVLQAEPEYSTRGTSATWYKIKVGSDYYYMCSSKVKLTSSFTAPSASASSGSSATAASTSTSSTANTGIFAYAQVDSSDGAILRKSASASSGSLGTLSDNVQIVIQKEVFTSKTSTSKDYKWYYVTADGKSGYLRSDYVDNIRYGSASGKTTETVNYRYGPGTEMKKKSSYSGNTNVTVVLQAEPEYSTRGTSATWYKIKVGSDYYYMCSSKVKLTSSFTAPSASASSGSSATAASTSTSSTANTGIFAYALVDSSDGAILRKSASTGSANLGVVSDNTQIAIQKEVFTSKTSTSKDYKWYYVTADGKSGYIRSDLVDNIKYGTVSGKTTETVNYRYGPGTEMKKKSSYSGNTNVTIVLQAEPEYSTRGTSATWYKIKVGSDFYYLCSSKAKLTGSFTAPAPPSAGASSGSSGTSGSSATTGSSATETQFVNTLNSAGFPDSYKKSLTELHKAHPNWVFVGYKTNIAWNTALSKQTSGGTSLVSGVYPSSYRDGSKQYETGWYKADSRVVAYYMDPRNFLNENSIYMFEDLSYKSAYQTTSVVGTILSPTKLPQYGFTANIFVNAGAAYNVSPVFLASRARQETGSGGNAVNGTEILGTKVYNAFNIGAFGGTDPLYNGLLYAYAKGWTTPKKAVEGGAQELAKNYINQGQYTGYYQRFNVRNGAGKVGTHQYMTNIMAPYSEALMTKDSYSKYGIINQSLVFEIPIYEGMPASTKLP